MRSYRWNGREAFFLYNVFIVNNFTMPFYNCRDTRKTSLDEMKFNLDSVVSDIVNNTGGRKDLFRGFLDSQCVTFDESELNTPVRIRKYMSEIYSKTTIGNEELSSLFQDERARRYTFASILVAIRSDFRSSQDEIFGGAFFNDVKNGSFQDGLECCISKSDPVKYIERCADIGVFPKTTFLSHLTRWNSIEHDYKMINWVVRNDDKVEWAWGYLIRKYLNGKEPGWITLSGKSMTDFKKNCSNALILFYDLLRDSVIKEALMTNLSRACTKKRVSEKQTDHKSSSYLLSNKVKQRLSALAEIDNKKLNKFIEDLINAEYDSRMRR